MTVVSDTIIIITFSILGLTKQDNKCGRFLLSLFLSQMKERSIEVGKKHELFGSVSKCLILAMLSKFFTLMLLHGFKSISALMLHL